MSVENSGEEIHLPQAAEQPISPAGGSSKLDEVSSHKVEVTFQAVGGAPILQRKKWRIEGAKPLSYVSSVLRGVLKMETDAIFFYVNQSFAPSPDQVLSNLCSCFGSEGKLVLHYSVTPAWG